MSTLKDNSCRFTCECRELPNHQFLTGFPILGKQLLLISMSYNFFITAIISWHYHTHGNLLITLYSLNITFNIENQLFIKYIGAIKYLI